MDHPLWNLETLGIVAALFALLLVGVFCFGLVWEALKWALFQVLRALSRCLPLAWRVAVVRHLPWLWNAQWRTQYLADHTPPQQG